MIKKEDIHPNDEPLFLDYIGYTYGKFCIARAYQPKVIIEIGVRAGYSAQSFLRAVPTAQYYGFDAENNSHGGEGGPYLPWAQKILSGYGNVHLMKMNTQEVESLNGDMGTGHKLFADFIHVDGDHSKKGVIHDLEMVLQHLNPDGVILIDDVDRIPAVKEGVTEFLTNHPELDHSYLPTFNGDVLIGKVLKLVSFSSASTGQNSTTKMVEPIYVDSYKDKKLVEYLKPGQRNLIRFGHGLGDTLLFMVIFEKLKELYPTVHFDLYVECGQEEIFESVADKNGPGCDYVFHLDYPMAEGSGQTKNAKCCIDEIGIDPVEGVASIDADGYKSPLVAVHYQGTALPGAVGIPAETAAMIWKGILNAGLIPIEVHFEHIYHNPKNVRYNFINRHVRGTEAKVSSLLGLLKSCRAFIGCASGPFVSSVAINGPEKTLLVEVNHSVSDYFSKNDPWLKQPQGIPINNVTEKEITKWLNTI